MTAFGYRPDATAVEQPEPEVLGPDAVVDLAAARASSVVVLVIGPPAWMLLIPL